MIIVGNNVMLKIVLIVCQENPSNVKDVRIDSLIQMANVQHVVHSVNNVKALQNVVSVKQMHIWKIINVVLMVVIKNPNKEYSLKKEDSTNANVNKDFLWRKVENA